MKIYTERELANELGVSPWTIRLWRIKAKLPYFRTAGRVFYRMESVLHWMEKEEADNVAKANSIEKANQLLISI
jgi:predicted site-specific integrase-resolvase